MNPEFTRFQKLPSLDSGLVSTGEPSDAPQGLGVRRLAGNGADAALHVGCSVSNVECFQIQSGVCPRPSLTALQDADAHIAASTPSRA